MLEKCLRKHGMLFVELVKAAKSGMGKTKKIG